MNRIKELRIERNLTQAQLAEMIGTTDATIQRIETGKIELAGSEERDEIAITALVVGRYEQF